MVAERSTARKEASVEEKLGKEIGLSPDIRLLSLEEQARIRRIVDDQEWSELSAEERTRFATWFAQLVNADLSEALAAGSFIRRLDVHFSRTISMVDEQGWRELSRIQAEALEASFAVQTESTERLAESGDAAIPVMSAMVCCELPPVGEKPA